MQADPKPKLEYRLESEKAFEINSDHSDVRQRARMLVILRNCLFGKKRYQNILLKTSFNNLFNALRIAQVLHSKVPDLAMIINFQEFLIIEMYDNNQSKNVNRRRVEIKLTTKPTAEDQARPGFNAGIPKEQITDPIEGVVPKRNPNDRKNNSNNNNRKTTSKRDNTGRDKTSQRRNQTRNNPPRYEKFRQDRRQRRYEQLEDEEDYRRDRRENNDRDRDRNQRSDKFVSRNRGGGSGRGGNRGNNDREREHNYNPSHIKK